MSNLPTFNPNDLEASGFYAADPNAVRAKLEQYREDGPSKLGWFTDWDGTATPRGTSTWPAIRAALPESVKKLHSELASQNVPKIIDGSITQEESRIFTTAALELLKNMDFIPIRRAMSEIRIRDGIGKIFDMCEKEAVPTIVRSAGISNCIEITAAANGIKPSLVIATRLVIKQGVIHSWEQANMTHDLDKSTAKGRGFRALTTGRPNRIVTGDTLSDTRMIGKADALFIRVVDSMDQKTLDESFRGTNPNYRPYDLVTMDESMLAMASLFEYILKSK